MKHYEYTYLTRPDMTEEEAKKLQDELAASIKAKGGTITDLPKAYKKRLAYRVKNQVAAYVNTILFQMEPAGLEAVKKETGGIAEILRGLLLSYDPEKMKEKPRRERGVSGIAASAAAAAATAEISATAAETTTVAEPARPAEEIKTGEPAPETEKKEEKEEPKPAKPRRRLKAKAELADIEEKLDEILK